MIDIKKKIVTGKGSRIFCHSSSYEFILRSLSCLTKYRSALKKSFFVTSIPGSTEWLNLNSSIWCLKYLTYQSGKQRRQPTANLRNGAYPKLGPSKKSTWKAEALKTWGKNHAGSKAKEQRAVTAAGSVTHRLQEAQNSPWRSLALPYWLPPGSTHQRCSFPRNCSLQRCNITNPYHLAEMKKQREALRETFFLMCFTSENIYSPGLKKLNTYTTAPRGETGTAQAIHLNKRHHCKHDLLALTQETHFFQATPTPPPLFFFFF